MTKGFRPPCVSVLRRVHERPLFAIVALLGAGCLSSSGQVAQSTAAGEMWLYESQSGMRVSEKVRAAAPGIVTDLYVSPGDFVRKGQILGHTELDAAKLQMELAKRALDNKSNVDAARSQAEAWTVARQETEEKVRKRDTERSRLEWAVAMEKMYQANYEAQLEAEEVQQLQYDNAKLAYEKRFFRAPVDGKVSEVLTDLGKPVNYATHVFTIKNDGAFAVPLSVPAPVAEAVKPNTQVPVRTADGKSVSKGKVESVKDDPLTAGAKIIQLLVRAADFPGLVNPKDVKFDVLLPMAANDAGR